MAENINDKLSKIKKQTSETSKVEATKPATTEPENPKKQYSLYAIIILLIIISAVGWGLYFNMKSDYQNTLAQLSETSDEKAEVTHELKELMVEYEDLKTDNEEVNKKLSQEQEKITQLLEELKKVKANNRWQIKKYKKELFTLREIMKSYIFQIDSLNTLNNNLIATNKNVTKENKKIKNKNKKLEELTSNLSTTVEKASVLRAIGIQGQALKKRGRKTKRASKTQKIQICFTLAENAVAKSGNRSIYVKIFSPDNQLLSNQEQSFEHKGEQIPYTEKREIEYNNKDIEACIFWSNQQKLSKGDYRIELFSEGYLIGQSTIHLK